MTSRSSSYSQPSSGSVTVAASYSPCRQADLAPELEPPSASLQAAVSSIFGQLETEAHAGDSSDTIQAVAVSQGSIAVNGFDIDDEGSIMRNGVAEAELTMKAMVTELQVELGRGRRAKTGSRRYGPEWEGY
jgi:hypothetical protein